MWWYGVRNSIGYELQNAGSPHVNTNIIGARFLKQLISLLSPSLVHLLQTRKMLIAYHPPLPPPMKNVYRDMSLNQALFLKICFHINSVALLWGLVFLGS